MRLFQNTYTMGPQVGSIIPVTSRGPSYGRSSGLVGKQEMGGILRPNGWRACGCDLILVTCHDLSITELTLIDPRHIDPYYTTLQCKGTSEYLCCPARTAHSSVKIHTSTIYTHPGVDTMWFLFQVNCPFTLPNRPFGLSQYWAQDSKASWQVSSKISTKSTSPSSTTGHRSTAPPRLAARGRGVRTAPASLPGLPLGDPPAKRRPAAGGPGWCRCHDVCTAPDRSSEDRRPRAVNFAGRPGEHGKRGNINRNFVMNMYIYIHTYIHWFMIYVYIYICIHTHINMYV